MKIGQPVMLAKVAQFPASEGSAHLKLDLGVFKLPLVKQ
jgi:hypothetical protein